MGLSIFHENEASPVKISRLVASGFMQRINKPSAPMKLCSAALRPFGQCIHVYDTFLRPKIRVMLRWAIHFLRK